jgi:hypothetical protein
LGRRSAAIYGSDRAQLANLGKQAKVVLGVDRLEAVADRGMTVTLLPKPMTSRAKSEGRSTASMSLLAHNVFSSSDLLGFDGSSRPPNPGPRMSVANQWDVRNAKHHSARPD